jgi:hypothetical protein
LLPCRASATIPACANCRHTRSASLGTGERARGPWRDRAALWSAGPACLCSHEHHALLDAIDGDNGGRDVDADRVLRISGRAWQWPAAWLPRTGASGAPCGITDTFRTSWMKPMSSMRSAPSERD